jgi:hypothetical protein
MHRKLAIYRIYYVMIDLCDYFYLLTKYAVMTITNIIIISIVVIITITTCTDQDNVDPIRTGAVIQRRIATITEYVMITPGRLRSESHSIIKSPAVLKVTQGRQPACLCVRPHSAHPCASAKMQ